ncbi:hypothetical protein C8R48DRAFT_369315 [Suillus tomentosus]|nr:hypothetical protein C8R48DRAFT_369315 [Suillus tomentosus]
MYLPWPWPWFGLFGMFLFLNDFGLTSRHREYENDAHPVFLQILVHTDLGHHDSSALGDPHMGSISVGACQRLFLVVHSLQHLRPTRVRTFVYQGTLDQRLRPSRTDL